MLYSNGGTRVFHLIVAASAAPTVGSTEDRIFNSVDWSMSANFYFRFSKKFMHFWGN